MDREPLLSSSQEDNTPGEAHEGSAAGVYRSNALKGMTALTVQGCGVALLALIWALVLSVMPLKPLPLFGYHPMIQSLAFLLLLQSIITLQPTSHDHPGAKRNGFRVHRAFNLALVLPLFTAGASIMWYLHDQPGQNHFISWHGILGTAVIVWTWIQVAAGIAATSFDGKLVGGMEKARSLWKWHRLSGYVLLPAFAFVIYLGSAQTSWAEQNANITHNVLVIVALLGILTGVYIRINKGKLPKLGV